MAAAQQLPLLIGSAVMSTWTDHNGKSSMFALFSTIDYVLQIYIWIVIASALYSWLFAFNVVNVRNPFVASVGNFLYKATEPVLSPIRRFLPDLGGLDISPIVVFVLIYFIRTFMWTTIAPIFLG